MTVTGDPRAACGVGGPLRGGPGSGRQRFPGGADRGPLRRVEVLLDLVMCPSRTCGYMAACSATSGTDPVLTASALSAMLEHFCYIWPGQGAIESRPASMTSAPSTPSPPSG
jgi:hypothetical protein